jgi:hypothetical protein
MANSVLNPCPTCGKRFDFPLTQCMTMVDEFLLASTGGKCPQCGTPVVIAGSPSPGEKLLALLAQAQSEEEINQINVAELELSVRSHLALSRAGLYTLGDLLQLTQPQLAERLSAHSGQIAEIEQLLAEGGLRDPRP